MSTLFLSHSSHDDDFVGGLRQALAEHGEEGWIDSRELHGGDPLLPAVKTAIEEASAFAVVVSPNALQSAWVGEELAHALKVQKKRGRENYPVIPLSLDGTKLGVLKKLFKDEPLFIPVSSNAGGIEAAVHAILVGMRKRRPTDVRSTPQPQAEPLEPLEELVLELTDLKFYEEDGVRRAAARARLVYEPATQGQPVVKSEQSWRLVAPIGPIHEELRWYLEKYAIWPSAYFQDRATAVEENLEKWGQLLHAAALPVEHTAGVMQAWATVDRHADRRFSVYVDAALEAGADDDDVAVSKEASTLLLGLPWELLHDGKSFLFHTARPTRVRRRLPKTELFEVPVVDTPIRILLVTARPEDDACGYIDHRVSALPLVSAMEALPGLVELKVLRPPTLQSLREELDRARKAREPYHVVHFDGQGVYDRTVGLGGLCFEDPRDSDKLEERRHETIYTKDLGPLLRDHRIPLVFLEACQSAQAEQVSESVASELLKVGVASVVAMSHSVLVETARRFVEAFYTALARAERVGDAMLASQRTLKDDTFRGRIFGVGEFRLEDWFVPVLFQEKADPQLFRTTPSAQTQEDFRTRLIARLGALPPEPPTGFIGRSRELLALERLLRDGRYAVIRGQGGEGKTALAAEFARWMVRSQQIRRAAFVCVEGLERNILETVLDKLGEQLVKQDFSTQDFSTQADCGGDVELAEQHIVRALTEQPTLLIMDNMESILVSPFQDREGENREGEAPGMPQDALGEELRDELDTLLALCTRLNAKGETRLIFTSREPLPAPFDAKRHRRELHQLGLEDAVQLVERVLGEDADADTAAFDARRESIEELVEAVHGHARTLALLAPSLRDAGVDATRKSLVKLLADMHRRFPGSREQSVFASVELSLRRMSPENQERARVLAEFHGCVDPQVLRVMMEWSEADVASLAVELLGTGLATPNRYNHLTLNPALCPYLRNATRRVAGVERSEPPAGAQTGDAQTGGSAALRPQPPKERDGTAHALTARWVEAMRDYTGFLVQQGSQNAELAATLTVLELPNLFALLDHVQSAGDAAATIDLATDLFSLLKNLGRPRLLERVGRVRDAAARTLGDDWTHVRFEAERTRIEQQLDGGRFREALDGAAQLLDRARTAGEQAYPGADYDLAGACWLLARVLKTAGGSEQALPLLDEARERFEAVAKDRPGRGAEGMASACFTEQGDCLRNVGRLDEAAAAYVEAIRRDEQRGDERDVAVGQIQLGTVRKNQRRYPEALEAFAAARERFTELDEPASVAVSWHQTGMAYQDAGNSEAAEDAYRKSLAIKVRLGNVAGQASTLNQLGNLYDDVLDRPEEAAAFYRQAADKHVEIGDAANEGRDRNNLARTLRKLRRLDEARQEIHRAIECFEPYGHAAQPWTAWSILAGIEADDAHTAVAAEARQKAIDCYLAYRRDRGENHADDGAPGNVHAR